MNTLKKILILTRLNVTIILMAIQIALFAILFYRFVSYLPIVSAIGYVISILIILSLVKKDMPPDYKTIWIIIVMALPIAGGILYLLFRNNIPTKKLAARLNKERGIVADVLKQNTNSEPAPGSRLTGIKKYVRQALSYPAYQNTETHYYQFGETMFEDMIAELSNATEFIFLEYFIISEGEMWERLLGVLTAKAQEGVDVRLICDDVGSMKMFTIPCRIKLKFANIKIVRFNPIVPFASFIMNNRDHRKIMVIDGHTAFVGGMNISDEYINKNNRLGVWKDTGVRLKGEAVFSFTLMFIETWNVFCRTDLRINDYVSYKKPLDESRLSDGFVLPFGDSPLCTERLGENIYIEILNHAEEYVYIFTPYLIISDKMIHSIQMAAKRGVDVRIVTPGVPDKKLVYRLTRAHYGYLLKAGVRIYEYTPGFLHAKSFVSDDRAAVVGTINLDYRSLYLNFECAVFLYNSSSVISVKEDALSTIADSREVTLDDRERKWETELLDAILHLFGPLL